jgi:alkylation response protein AidB-like acyl-CoA dehydrogenase
VLFAFTEEQRLVQSSVRQVLERVCPPAEVRASWSSETGRSPERWAALAELGVTGLLVPEEHGGLGQTELDLVLILEEAGRAALPEPLVETVAVGAPLLAETGSLAFRADWLSRVASGEALLAVGLADQPLVADAHVASLLLVEREGALLAVPRDAARLTREPSIDGARRLYRVDFDPAAAVVLADGDRAREAAARARDRGAFATAAVLVGLGRWMLATTTEYVKVRRQFGKPIGSFQAIKHALTDALLALELAGPVVYRAAYSMARGSRDASLYASMAKARASDAARVVARAALQCHGAIGYTTEHDLHHWMKRAWALAAAWGDAALHRERVAAAVLDQHYDPEGD